MPRSKDTKLKSCPFWNSGKYQTYFDSVYINIMRLLKPTTSSNAHPVDSSNPESFCAMDSTATFREQVTWFEFCSILAQLAWLGLGDFGTGAGASGFLNHPWVSDQVVDWNRNIFTTWSWSPQKMGPDGWFMKRSYPSSKCRWNSTWNMNSYQPGFHGRGYKRLFHPFLITFLLEDHLASLGSIETILASYDILCLWACLLFTPVSTCITCSPSEKKRQNLLNTIFPMKVNC